MGGGKRLTAVSFVVGSPGDSLACVMQIWGTSVCMENRKSSRTPRKRKTGHSQSTQGLGGGRAGDMGQEPSGQPLPKYD